MLFYRPGMNVSGIHPLILSVTKMKSIHRREEFLLFDIHQHPNSGLGRRYNFTLYKQGEMGGGAEPAGKAVVV
jgi:hypothetical protein